MRFVDLVTPGNPNGRADWAWSARPLFGGGVIVEFTGTAAASFSAAHVIKGHPRCGRNHGHRWRVEVAIKAGQDPQTGDLVGLPDLADAVERFCAEFDREDINDMLLGGTASPAGIALFFRERLAMEFRTIESVTVWMDDVRTTLHA